MSVRIEQIDFHGWPHSYRISNGTIEAVVTGDVGPRIMRFAFAGGRNLFKEFADQLGKSGEPDWQPRGGHRIWIAPEDPIRSYAPDNHPVAIAQRDGALEATGPVEGLTALEKKMTVRMAAEGAFMEVIHQIRNLGANGCKIALWVLTMMAAGGAGIHRFPPRGTHPEMLAPGNPLVMWAFTDLSDPRWRLLRKYLVLLQDPANPVPQKLGSFHRETWGAYLLDGELFVKRCAAPGVPADYPDLGCSFETFTNAEFLELETLGPLVELQPGESVTHSEQWSLHRGVQIAEWSDEELDRALASAFLPV